MKKRLTLFLNLILISCITQAQFGDTKSWKGYIDYRVDTIVQGYHFVGEYKNQLKEGWWQVFYDGDIIAKAFYQKDSIIQIEGTADNVYYKIYSDAANNKSYTIRRNNAGKIFVRIDQTHSNKQEDSEELWFSNQNELVSDTSFGVKKLDEVNYIDRNNNKYSIASSKVTISDHDLIDEQLTTNDEGNYVYKRKSYKLYNNRMMSFRNNNLKQYIDFTPVYTFTSEAKKRYSLKSRRKDVFSFNEGPENTITYEVLIDTKPVLEGNISSSGIPIGIWNLYHFTFYDDKDEKRTAAFSAAKLIEFSTIIQGNAPYINMYDFNKILLLTPSDITNDFTQEYLSKIEKAFTSIDEPYLFTKFATFTKSGNDLTLNDKLGHHLFQKLHYKDGKMFKGYLFAPDGKMYDSINLEKDEFGETITKNSVFKKFPEHPMAQAFQKQLIDGVEMVLNTATKYLEDRNKEEWKNTKCKHCNKSVDYNTAVVIDGITCGNSTYPGGGIFCSSKCRYEYEKGYCRNK